MAVAMCLGGSATASATTVFVTFSGVITFPQSPFAPMNAPYSGQLRYDTDAAFAFHSLFDFFNFGASDYLSVSVGGCTFSGTGTGGGSNRFLYARNQILNSSLPGDIFSAVVARDSSTCPSILPDLISVDFVGPPGLLPGSGVPTSLDFSMLGQPSYSGYSTGMSLVFATHGVSGNLTSVEFSSVPEPSTAVLSGFALAGLLLKRRFV
jgi:hypothetical protein